MTPRERIAAAFSPEWMSRLTTELGAILDQHFNQVQVGRGPVLNWAPPRGNLESAGEWLDTASDEPTPERFRLLIQEMLGRGHNLHHPRYVGHQVPAPVPIAGLFDAVGSITNQVMAVYEMGPWATAVEQALVRKLGERFGLGAGFGGIVTHGGSLANVTALQTARNVGLPGTWENGTSRPGRPPVLLVQADAHYSIVRAAGVLGLGTRHVLPVPLDDQRRMRPQALEQMLRNLQAAGQPVVAVCACACSTPVGAFDPLEDIADICRRYGVWLHVDAAHGGGLIFSSSRRHLLKGLEHADSFVCDAHKMLFVPALCAFVFYRDGRHRAATFQQNAPYLFAADNDAEFDNGLYTMECTKRAATFGLWGLWSLCGPGLFEDMVDVTCELAHWFAGQLQEAPDFELINEPQCNIVCFRYLPRDGSVPTDEGIGRLNQAIRTHLVRSGEFYLVQTTLDGRLCLRVTIINPLTTEDTLSDLLEAIRRVAPDLQQSPLSARGS